MGDIHGHLIPRAGVRSDAPVHGTEGGIARIKTLIDDWRRIDHDALVVNTGDTLQGSAEALYTRGQAIVDVLNLLGIDAYTPGNWDFVYGNDRFLGLFTGGSPAAPWTPLAANLRYSTLAQDPTTPYPARAGQRVLPPYVVRDVNGVKVGLMGMTTNRGPQVVGAAITKGFAFSLGAQVDADVDEVVTMLRDIEHVDAVVMLSELGLAYNIRIATSHPGIDVILSSDMHEETRQEVITATGTILVEEGQDGTMLGRLRLEVEDGRVVGHDWLARRVDGTIPEDPSIASVIAQIRAPFVRGPNFNRPLQVNPFNGTTLQRPIDTIVGFTAVPLLRQNFSSEALPGVIEGASHDVLADAFRAMTGADVGVIRGFRYGTQVPAGPIKMEDLYHFIPIGPQIASGMVTGAQIAAQIETVASGSFDTDVTSWTGGWLFGYSGLTMDFDPSAANGARSSNIRIHGQPLVPTQLYSYASYWYPTAPTQVNATSARNITVLRDPDGNVMDGTEVVYRYLQQLPDHTVSPTLGRISLIRPLPAPVFGNPEIQPLRGGSGVAR